MKFCIITPTLFRRELVKCCESINIQSHNDWYHVIVYDLNRVGDACIPARLLNSEKRLWVGVYNSKTFSEGSANYAISSVAGCGTKADYVLILPDDDYYAAEALEVLDRALKGSGRPEWAVFPMMCEGRVLYDPNPGYGRTSSTQIVYKPVIGGNLMKFPDVANYAADGIFIEELRKFGGEPLMIGGEPLAVMPKAQCGRIEGVMRISE